jgi:uncharacterized membrane protein
MSTAATAARAARPGRETMPKLLTAIATAALTLGLAGIAAANEFDVDAGKRKTETVAKQLCKDDKYCVAGTETARYCDKSTDHKARCIAFYSRRKPDGDRQVCRTPVTVKLSHESGRYSVGNVGKTRCR